MSDELLKERSRRNPKLTNFELLLAHRFRYIGSPGRALFGHPNYAGRTFWAEEALAQISEMGDEHD